VALSAREAEALAERKLKWGLKVAREEAIDANFFRMFDAYAPAAFASEYTMMDTLFSSLYAAVFYGIPLAEVAPWQLLWEVELPSLEEYLSGVLVKLVQVPPETLYPFLSAIEETLEFVFSPETLSAVRPAVPSKAVYGRSRYDASYFDPTAVREFLRSTLFAFAKRGTSPSTVRARVTAAADVLELREEAAEDAFNRLALIEAAKDQVALADYAWADRTAVGDGRVRFRDFRNREVEVEVWNLADALLGCYADLSFADLCHALPADPEREYPFRVEPVALRAALSALVETFLSGFRRRFHATALAIANYQTAEERARPVPEAAERYSVPTSHKLQLDALVDGALSELKPDATAVERNMYKVAVASLYGELYGVHRWGAEMQRAMAREELKRFWLERWAAMGLDERVLGELFERAWPALTAFGGARWRSVFIEARKRLRG